MDASPLQGFKADFFHALAHPVRIAILETLGTGERTVQELQQALGASQPVVSQHLAVLRTRSIVTPRKLGTTVQYTLTDPLITDLLGVAREIFNRQLVHTRALLKALQREKHRS